MGDRGLELFRRHVPNDRRHALVHDSAAEDPDHAISRISSFDWFGSVVLNPIGYALIGPLAARLGISAVLIACAVLNGAIGIGLLLVPAVRNLRWDPAEEPGPASAA